MSFSYNPLEHIEIVMDDNELWFAYCHACGANLKPHSANTPLWAFRANIAAHVRSSHERTPEDFKDWSKV